MKKAERLADMMIYLNDKNAFQLGQLMRRYGISRSTALRDVRALEEIGMPLYSYLGRNGHYGILPNRLLSPILFTTDELSALYFAMQTLQDYETTPFHMNLQTLQKKFESCLSPAKKQGLQRVQQVLRMGTVPHANQSPLLREILDSAIGERVCEIEYQKQKTLSRYTVQFYEISSSFRQWYVTAHNFETKKPQVFRCDKIQSIEPSHRFPPHALHTLLQRDKNIFRGDAAVDFEVAITEKGVDFFRKEHYPTMELQKRNNQYFVKGFYNPAEEAFIASYFVGFGETVSHVEPLVLRKAIARYLKVLLRQYN